MNRSFMKRVLLALIITCFLSYSAFSSEVSNAAFVEGCKAFSNGDWTSAELLLRRAVGYTENQTPDTYYMLISSEVFAGDDSNALDDCDTFLEMFPNSLYFSRVQYTKGHLLYRLGEYEKAIIVLSDFCHHNENDDMYSYALFYIGESLFAGYKYDEADAIYQRIIVDFPDSEKATAAQYRSESILQRAREEKLLYLLKQTGEEYLSAKEEYEKQLRLYNADSINTTKKRLAEAQLQNKELEDRIRELESQIANLKLEHAKNLANAQKIAAESENLNQENSISSAAISDTDIPNAEPYDEAKSQLIELKKKASDAQKLLNGRK